MKKLLKDSEFIRYWDFEKNYTVDIDTLGVGDRNSFFWKCPKCNYEWKTRISHVINDSKGCPNCNKNERRSKRNKENGLISNNKVLMKEWNYEKNEKLGIQPENFSVKSKDKRYKYIKEK